MQDQTKIARQFLDCLRAGNAPWRYPHNRLPAFEPLFGMYFSGIPQDEAEVDYGELDVLIKASGAKIKHHWRCGKPRYVGHEDRIVMPLRAVFLNERQYRATLIHEVLHFIEPRHRVGWIGSSQGAELVAEIGTGMIESFLRLPHDTDNTNIESFLPWWTMETYSDPEYLFDAIAQAERAADYLLERWHRVETCSDTFAKLKINQFSPKYLGVV